MMRKTLFSRAAALLAVSAVLAQEPADDAKKAPAPKPDPQAVLAKAFAKAKVHNKRVLGVLAPAGFDVAGMLQKVRKLSRPIMYEFEVAQFQGNDADGMATKWQFADAVQKKPALCVLDADGKVLAREVVADLVQNGSVDADPLLAKLRPHFCEPVDAEAKLKSALAEAKKTGRAVFVRFDAPW
ncbi:MAG: hypothetical protein U1E73_07110 [Planctomycetota bacterium]